MADQNCPECRGDERGVLLLSGWVACRTCGGGDARPVTVPLSPDESAEFVARFNATMAGEPVKLLPLPEAVTYASGPFATKVVGQVESDGWQARPSADNGVGDPVESRVPIPKVPTGDYTTAYIAGRNGSPPVVKTYRVTPTDDAGERKAKVSLIVIDDPASTPLAAKADLDFWTATTAALDAAGRLAAYTTPAMFNSTSDAKPVVSTRPGIADFVTLMIDVGTIAAMHSDGNRLTIVLAGGGHVSIDRNDLAAPAVWSAFRARHGLPPAPLP